MMVSCLKIITISLFSGTSTVTHIFGYLCGITAGPMMIVRDIRGNKDKAKTVSKYSHHMSKKPKSQKWKQFVKIALWTVFWILFGTGLGINIVGSRVFVGFWST